MTTACYFEDATPGYSTSAKAYELTEAAIIAFAKDWDPMPFHVDPEKALNSPFKGLTASGAHLYAIFVKLAHKQPRKMAVLAALGIENLQFKQAARPGDRLVLKGTCIAQRASSSKPDRGICTFEFKLVNQSNETILSLTQPLLLSKRQSTTAQFSEA